MDGDIPTCSSFDVRITSLLNALDLSDHERLSMLVSTSKSEHANLARHAITTVSKMHLITGHLHMLNDVACLQDNTSDIKFILDHWNRQAPMDDSFDIQEPAIRMRYCIMTIMLRHSM
jgi:hypothetical protein